MDNNVIDIRPATSVYGTYRRLSYKPWFAIAEFIDNSTQSYFNHKKELKNAEGFKKLIINIEYNSSEDYLEITDNAFGMNFEDFTRAIVLDKPPKDTTGRNEFGMGLKTAACWFGDLWSVETSMYGSDKEYSAIMDIKEFEKNKPDQVLSKCKECNPERHYTKIRISKLNQKPVKRSVSKIKETLEKIYRKDLSKGDIDIIWNGEHLEYNEPKLRVENGKEEKKEISFTFSGPDGLKCDASGWIGILEKGSYPNAGFSLLRRGRVIVGAINKYTPDEIFGSSGGDYRRLYLVGEISIDNIKATQAKDGFMWDNGLEDAFIEKLDEITDDFQKKAQNMRNINQSKKISEIPEQKIGEIVNDVKDAFENISVDLKKQSESPSFLEKIFNKKNEKTDILEENKIDDKKVVDITPIPIDGYNFIVKWSDENELAPWLTIKEHHDEYGNQTKDIDIIINVCHKFFVPYINKPEFLTLINKFAIAMIVAEKRAKSISTDNSLKIDPESIRTQMNKCLSEIANKEQ